MWALDRKKWNGDPADGFFATAERLFRAVLNILGHARYSYFDVHYLLFELNLCFGVSCRGDCKPDQMVQIDTEGISGSLKFFRY